MIQVIRTIPQSQAFLRQRSRKIKNFPGEAPRIVQDLCDTWPTVAAYGIAAPQIGESFRIFIYRPSEEESVPPTALINPKILHAEGELTDYDGCLSVPGIYGRTRRAAHIEILAWDTQGTRIRQTFDGFTARIIQHEIDHLEGVLFIDRIDEMGQLYSLREIQDADGKNRWEEVPLNESLQSLIIKHQKPLPAQALRW